MLNRYLLCLFVFSSYIFAFDSIEVFNPNITLHKSGYFKTTKNLTPDEALKQDFVSLPKNAKSFGFDHDTYWFIFEISTTSNEQFFLDSRDILGTYQTLYVYKNNQLIRNEKNGFYLPEAQKQLDTFSTRFKLESNSKKIIYLLKIDSIFMRLTSFALGNEYDVEQVWTHLLIILIAVSTLAIAFLIYNFCLYILTKDKLFLFYIVYMFSFFFVNQLSLGYLPFLLGMNGQDTMILWIFAMLGYIFGLIFFTLYFLDLQEKYKTLKMIFIGLFIINIILTPFHIFTGIIPNSQSLWLLSIQSFQFFAIYLAIKRYQDGFKPALYYLIATGGGLVSGICFTIFIGMDGIPYSMYSLNFPNIGLVWDLIFFSLALAFRMKTFQNEKEQQERLLTMNSRNAAVGEFASNVAHQWRQPLTSLSILIAKLEAKLLFEKYVDNKKLEEFIKSSNQTIEHLSSTIDVFQGFFTSNEEQKLFSIANELERTLNFVEDSFQSYKIQIQLNITKDAMIKGDSNTFSQAILNLLSNAKDALNKSENSDKIVRISLDIKNGYSIITLEDNSGGIKLQPIEKIFEPYITTKGLNGVGIGLFIVKNIIEQKFGGIISAKNTKDGACFEIKL